MLSGSVLEIAPLEGDDFQSLLPLLPGVLRGPDGRLRAKGGQPTQGALQISSASLIDPSSGDFDLQLPGQSIESVELLTNPFAAEYGRFSTSVVQLRTRRGTNDWEIKPGNFVPRFRKGFSGVRGFEPRFSIRGPLRKDRLFLAQDFQFRYVNDPVKSLPDEPEIGLTSFDSFTRIDSVLSPRHTLGGLIVMFPRKIENLTMHTFRPPEVTPQFNQSGASVGVQDRFAISPTMVLESTLAGRWFEINVNTDGRQAMVYAPETQQGSFFNDQEREVRSVQWVEALSVSLDKWHGQHLFKFGLDFQDSKYVGSSISRPVELRRLDGSLAERIVPGGALEAGGQRPLNSACLPRIVGGSDRASPSNSAPGWIGGRHRARELVTARRRLGLGASRRARDSPRRCGPVSPADAAQYRCVRRIRITRRDAVWTRGSTTRPARGARERSVTRPADAEGGRRQHRVEPAIWPPGVVQSQLPEAKGSSTSTFSSPARRAAKLDSSAPAHRSTGRSK